MGSPNKHFESIHPLFNQIFNMIKATIFAVLVSITLAQKPGPYGDLKEGPPKPYNYQYGVSDGYSKANFQKTESQDSNGNVKGQYVIALPDGRIQTTSYTADHVNGYIAEVTFQGTPVYPKEVKPYSANLVRETRLYITDSCQKLKINI